MTIQEKYQSEFAKLYKEKLTAELEGREWTAPAPSTTVPSFASAMPAAAMGAGAGAAQPGLQGHDLPSKQDNEDYFGRMGVQNQTRAEGVPPSQGGKYVGFGSGGPAGSPSSGVANLLEDPLAALSKGWSLFASSATTALGVLGEGAVKGAKLAAQGAEELGRGINANVIQPTTAAVRDPNLAHNVKSAATRFGSQVTEAGASGLRLASDLLHQATTGRSGQLSPNASSTAADAAATGFPAEDELGRGDFGTAHSFGGYSQLQPNATASGYASVLPSAEDARTSEVAWEADLPSSATAPTARPSANMGSPEGDGGWKDF
jgi:ADP-ribosylation factor GTPase-activating protein 1